MGLFNYLPVTKTEALKIVLCANHEIVADGFNLCNPEESTKDAVRAAIEALEKIDRNAPLCVYENQHFSHWRGGRYSRRNLGHGHCYIVALHREVHTDEDGEEIEGAWTFTPDKDVTPLVKDTADKLATAANLAYRESLRDWERTDPG